MHIVIDTETTGLIQKGQHYARNYNQFPHIVSIAWKIEGQEPKHFIVKPTDWSIPRASTRIHGITTAQALQEGRELLVILLELFEDMTTINKRPNFRIVGHNLYFDMAMIKANYLREQHKLLNDENNPLGAEQKQMAREGLLHNINSLFNKKYRVDTMFRGIKLMRTNKFPTLSELYFRLFKATFNAHNALDDVLATEKCYLYMK